MYNKESIIIDDGKDLKLQEHKSARRLSEFCRNGEVYSTAIGYGLFEPSINCDWELCAVLEALSVYPHLI